LDDKPSPPGGLPPPRFLIDAPWFREFVGRQLIGGYMDLVFRTSPATYEPADALSRMAALEPAIFVSWHANILTSPILVPNPRNLVSMAAPHPDGQMGAAGSRRFGIETITATGKSERQNLETGGVAGFRMMLRKLAAGKSVYVTGEVPPMPGRIVGRGTLALARLSGRPIIPVAAASTRRKIFTRLWDEMQWPGLFGKFTVVMGEPIEVRTAAEEETAAALLKERLDSAYARALAVTEKR
jgi:lysophospholipid acyltransferase (LPLAT)-like uncharacterized protein